MRKFSVLVICVFVMVAFVGTAWAEDPFVAKRHTWTGKQTFLGDGAIDMKKGTELRRAGTEFKTPFIVDLGGTSVYTIDKSKGSEFWIDDYQSTLGTRVASGVSIIFPKITSKYDKYVVRIRKMTGLAYPSATTGATPFSGTTRIVLSTTPWVSGTTDFIWNATTGATVQSAAKVAPEVSEIDAVGDYLTFMAVYNVTGSTWYQIERYIQ